MIASGLKPHLDQDGYSEGPDEAQRVVDGGVGVAGGDGVADAEESIITPGVAGDCLGAAVDEGLVVDLAEVDGAGAEFEVDIIERARAVVHHHLVDAALAGDAA